MGTLYSFHENAASVATPAAADIVPLNQSGVIKQATADNYQAFNGRYRYFTAEGGNIGVLANAGTSTTVVADKTYYADVFIPETGKVLTGIGWLNGTTATTDKTIVSLYNSAGTLLANSVVAGGGTLVATSNIFQQVAFTATYTIVKPGRYWIGYQQNGTTATPRTIAAATWVNVLTGSATGTNAVVATTITPPTTFTADVGPIAYVY